MSIACRTASFVCASALLVLTGASAADAPSTREAPPAKSDATPAAPENSAAPAPAEPIPSVPATLPVMPTTVVRPAAKPTATPPLRLSLGRFGAIELGRPPATASRWHGFPISLSLRDAPLPEVLRSFARLAGVNLVLAPGVTGTVTVELKDVPWDQALWVILKTQGMAAEIDGRVWSVEPR